MVWERGKNKNRLRKKLIGLKHLIKSTAKSITPSNDSQAMIRSALLTARKHIKKAGGRRFVKISRTLPIPKIGGLLPALNPLFAGLSTLGSLADGAARITQAINKENAIKKQMEEQQRHNKKMEELSIGKGLYLKPYAKGYGISFKK